MAEAAAFVGWGAPVRGREQQALQVFNEAVQFWGRLQEEGAIESFEVVLLEPHGGDLNGFALLRGSREQIAAVRAREDVQRLNTRADLIVEQFGFVDAATGEGISEQMGIYQEAIQKLTS